MMQGRSDDALQLAEEALVEAAAAGEREALARAYTVLDAACLTLGRAAEAEYLPRALAMYEEMGDLLGVAQVTNNMGERAWLEGRLDDAVDLFSRSDETSLRAGNDPMAANARANIAEVLMAQGRVDEARVLLEDATRVLRAHGSQAVVFADIHLGRVELETGETEMSIEILSGAVAEATEMGQSEWAHMASIHLADAYARQGDLSEAVQLLDEVESQSDKGGDLYGPLLAMVRAAVLRDLGQPIEALESVRAGRDIARRLMLGREESQLDQLVSDLSRLVGEVPGTSPTNPLPSTT
jgi:tetratricopeptide (TPR) repeat protein